MILSFNFFNFNFLVFNFPQSLNCNYYFNYLIIYISNKYKNFFCFIFQLLSQLLPADTLSQKIIKTKILNKKKINMDLKKADKNKELITSDDFHFFKRLEHKLLGKGCYGSVYEAIDFQHPERRLAVKVIDLNRFPEIYKTKLKKNVEEEVNILSKLHHENIVQIRKLIITSEGNKINIFMDKCDTDILEVKYSKPDKRFSEEETLYFFKKIAKAMFYVQKRNILHRDIKPANILISENEGELIPKICDFGFGAIVKDVEKPTNHFSNLGSPLYKAPQLYLEQDYSYKCDVWSTGVMIFELLFGYPPWNSKVQKEDDLFENNIFVKPLTFPISIECSKEFKKTLTGMLQIKEEDRIGWEEILSSDLMKDTIPICLGELSQTKGNTQMIKEMVKVKDFSQYIIHKLGICKLIDQVLEGNTLKDLSDLFEVKRKIFRKVKFVLKKLQMIYLYKIVKLIDIKNNEKFSYKKFENEMKEHISDYFQEKKLEFMEIYEITKNSKSLIRDDEFTPIANENFKKSKNKEFGEIFEISLTLFFSSIQITRLNQIKEIKEKKMNKYLKILFILKSISCQGRIKKNFKFFQSDNENAFKKFDKEIEEVNMKKLIELFNE